MNNTETSTRIRHATFRRIVTSILVLVLPVLAAGLFVNVFSGVASGQDRIPARIVNADTMLDPIEPGGPPIFAGRQLVTELTGELGRSSGFDWVISNAEDAKAALEDGEAYAVLTIPSDFSKAILSVSGETPEKGVLKLETNESHSYIAGPASNLVAEALARGFGSEVTKQYLTGLYQNLGGMSGPFQDAAGGATQLAEGVNGLSDGLNQLADGTAASSDGAKQLASGLRSYTSGVRNLAGGVKQLNGQAGALGTLGSGINQYVDGTSQLAAALNQAVAALNQDPTDPVALSTINTLNTQLSQATAQGGGLKQGAAGLNALKGGIANLNSGAATLAANGLQLVAGANGLTDGLGQLSVGADESATGAGQLARGATELADGLTSGSEQLGQLDQMVGDAQTRAAVIADPVAVHVVRTNEIAKAEQAAGIVALPLALWVGALAVFIMARKLRPSALLSTYSSARILAVRGLRYLALLLGQAAVGLGLLYLVLRLNPATLGAVAPFALLVAAAFGAIHFGLGRLFGKGGAVVSLLFLAVQLVLAPGLLPLAALAPWLQNLGAVLPVGHATAGIQAIVAGEAAGALLAAGVLAAWAVIGGLVGYVKLVRQRAKVTAVA